MKALATGIERFLRDEDGVTMVEYGMIAALVSVVAVAALANIGSNINTAFTEICNKLANAVKNGKTCA